MQATGSRAPPSPRAPQLAPSAPPPQPSCQLRARAGAASASLAPARPGYYMATAHFRRRTSLSTRARPAGRMAHAHFACRGGGRFCQRMARGESRAAVAVQRPL